MTPHEAEAQAIQQMQQLKQEWGIRNPHIVIHAVFPGILDNLREG